MEGRPEGDRFFARIRKQKNGENHKELTSMVKTCVTL